VTNAAKAKGSRAERQLADHLIAHGWPCERIPAGATADRGDLWVPVIEFPSIDVKDHGAHSLGAWIDRAAEQANNAGRTCGSVVWKRRGKADPAEWFWIFNVRGFLNLMEHLR